MAKNLLPIRILFHSAFALVYLPTIPLAFILDSDFGGPVSLSALGGLGLFAALKVNQRAFLCIDIFLAFSLPMCLLSFIDESIDDVLLPESDGSGAFLPIDLAATVIIIGLTVSYVLYIIITAVIDKVRGNAFLPADPDDPPPSSYGTQRKVFFIGRRRTPTERVAVSDHCNSYIFQRSVFRKHAFEPTGWAIFRGIIAVYCFVGLVVFAAYEGYSGEETYASGGPAIQETILPASQVAQDFIGYLSVAMLSLLSQSAPSDLTVSGQNLTLFGNWSVITGPRVLPDVPGFGNSGPLQLGPNNQSLFASPFYGYPWVENNDFNVSWSGDVTLDIWVISSYLNGSTDSFPAIYSPGFPLFPFKEYVITLTIISYEMNGFYWLFLEPKIYSAVDSGSTNTTARFSCRWQSQGQIIHRVLTLPSGPVLFVRALSTIGGLYASIDGVFALIFGRTLIAILFGSKIISPFGLLGILTRDRLRRLIYEQYPRLREDIERGGMAAYVSEVAIDPGLMMSSNSAPGRVTIPSQGSYTEDNAEETDLIPLRSMEPSTSGSTSHSQLQLPYVIEDYEPARKHDYE